MAYTYEPLPQDCHTRILELYPALDPNAPLRGNFRFVDLNINPFYDAISYTWGEPDFTTEILIGDDLCVLCITANLRDALVRYRFPTESRSIWADAICIDQANEEDKRKQIPSMRDIYRCASSVLVWLGKDPLGEACLREIALLSQRKTVPVMTSGRGKITSILNRLVSLSWFSRRWVIQEIVLNPNVTFFCGAVSVPWLRAAQLLKYIPRDDSSPRISHLHTLKELWDVHNSLSLNKCDGQNTGILHLLSTFAETDCADARDRIYALAGLARDVVFDANETIQRQNSIFIHIDYTSSVKQVYYQFARAVGETGGDDSRIRLLEEAGRRSNGSYSTEWLSWVPDWRISRLYPDVAVGSRGLSGIPLFGRGKVLMRSHITAKIESIISQTFPRNGPKSMQILWINVVLTAIKKQIEDREGQLQLAEFKTGLLSRLLSFTLTGRSMFLRSHDYAEDLLEVMKSINYREVPENHYLFTISTVTKEGTTNGTLVGVGPRHMRVGDIVFLEQTELTMYGIATPIFRETTESQRGKLDQSGEGQQGGAGHEYVKRRACYLVGFAFINGEIGEYHRTLTPMQIDVV
ncbi:heterokaryon incompatibility protein-domain-containing protein [Xylaria telfairii]|nr:heterokaryon incompatibility protein-domain-containing protein [Xylaria telfairii]